MPCVSACLHLFLFLHVCLSPTKPTFPTFPYLYKASRDEIRTYLCFLCTHSLVHPRAWVSRLAPQLGQTPSVLLLGLILPPLNPSAPPHCFQGTPPPARAPRLLGLGRGLANQSQGLPKILLQLSGHCLRDSPIIHLSQKQGPGIPVLFPPPQTFSPQISLLPLPQPCSDQASSILLASHLAHNSYSSKMPSVPLPCSTTSHGSPVPTPSHPVLSRIYSLVLHLPL